MTQPDWTSKCGGVRLYCGDCVSLLPTIDVAGVDAIVTDPPYGLGKRWTGGTWFTKGAYAGDDVEWDAEAPAEAVSKLVCMGKPSIVWGGNYFALPPSRCWLSWVKRDNMPTMADFELAWTNLDRPSKEFYRARSSFDRQHPTQKPDDLMLWCLGFLPKSQTILDPFMGSGTTGIACVKTGRRFIGIEKEPKYFEIAKRRIESELNGQPLFQEAQHA